MRWTLKTATIALAACLAGSGVATADQFVEGFDGGGNVGSWTFGAAGESIPSSGGNPGAFLHAAELDAAIPYVHTLLGSGSIFSGDYRAAGVTSVGIDLRVIDIDVISGARECTVMLYSDNGTPGTELDDWGAYRIGPFISFPGFGWLSVDFDVPSQETSMPAGWQGIVLGPNSPPANWNTLITNVASLGFYFGDPTGFFLPEVWELGADNPRITADNVVPAEDATWGAVKRLFQK